MHGSLAGEVHGDVNALLRSGLADMSEAETAKVMLGRVGHDRRARPGMADPAMSLIGASLVL